MKVIKTEYKQCVCCMEVHEVPLVLVQMDTIFKDELIEYEAVCEYCELADEYYATDYMITENDISVKNAYREKIGLLTIDEIYGIRHKYGISQKDLALLLDWGTKTITRYEGHQVQDAAHDAVLRKINDDPGWYFVLLEKQKELFSEKVFQKYYQRAAELFEQNQNQYLRKSIEAKYVKYHFWSDYNGGVDLNLDKVIEVMCYFANAKDMDHLYKVKMMKLLWYADALSYKKRGKSMTGLVYQSMPMGAVPIGHKSIMELEGVVYEEIDCGDTTGYHFIKNKNVEYSHLDKEDRAILDIIIEEFKDFTREEIVERMHNEEAYTETVPGEIISFVYAKELSVC